DSVVAADGPAPNRRVSQVPSADVGRAADALAASSRPLLLIGGGAWRAADSLRELVELLSIPVVMTSSGKGIVAEDHPLSLGDGWMSHQIGREALEQADFVLAVGVRFGPLTTSWWTRRIGGRAGSKNIYPARKRTPTRAN